MGKWFPPKASTAERTGLTPDDGSFFYDEDEQTFYAGDGTTSGGVTLKGDPGPTGPPGAGLADVVDDLTPQAGGNFDMNGHSMGKDKGGDLASASPLVIGVDGDYFDVTGTTGFATMTVAANRLFIIQFDAVLTITNGGSISIPGGANFTTAVGDQLLCFSTATNTVRIVDGAKADGTPFALDLSQDLTPQLGGSLDPDGNSIGLDKGGDLASASPLVIGVDGDYFDVTGTTGFATMTVAANRRFRLQFDGAVLITVGSGITLNNAGGNFTTAAGDIIDFQSTAANTVVGTITKADGTPLVSSGGGAWNLIGTVVASASATLDITGLDSTYDTYVIVMSDLVAATNGQTLRMRVGDSGGFDSGASDYRYHQAFLGTGSTAYQTNVSTGATEAVIAGATGNTAGDGAGGILFLNRPGDGASSPFWTGDTGAMTGGSLVAGGPVLGARNAVIVLDRVQIFFGTGNITSGRFSIFGVSHA